MDAEGFAAIFKKEKENLFNLIFSEEYAEMNTLIKKLGLSDAQVIILKQIINQVLTDTFYSILLGLDGAANIGGVQQLYKIYDQDDNLISSCGHLEAAAYEAFHENK